MANVQIPVPTDPKMANEPARTIAKETATATVNQYSNVDRLKLLAAAVLGILAMVGVNVAPGLGDQVENAIEYGSPLAVSVYAWWQTERTKKQAIREQATVQAEETREAVYAPATVDRLVAQARRT